MSHFKIYINLWKFDNKKGKFSSHFLFLKKLSQMVALKSPHPVAWTIWLRASSSAIIFPSPPTLKNFSLCIRSIWRPMCIFCFALYTQYGHWNCGSLPHSHFWWLRKDDFNLYIRPQSGHEKPPSCEFAPPLADDELLTLGSLLPARLPDDVPFGERPSGTDSVFIVLTHRSRGNTNGCGPSRSVVTRGIANLSFHCSHVRPAIFVILKSSAAVRWRGRTKHIKRNKENHKLKIINEIT